MRSRPRSKLSPTLASPPKSELEEIAPSYVPHTGPDSLQGCRFLGARSDARSKTYSHDGGRGAARAADVGLHGLARVAAGRPTSGVLRPMHRADQRRACSRSYLPRQRWRRRAVDAPDIWQRFIELRSAMSPRELMTSFAPISEEDAKQLARKLNNKLTLGIAFTDLMRREVKEFPFLTLAIEREFFMASLVYRGDSAGSSRRFVEPVPNEYTPKIVVVRPDALRALRDRFLSSFDRPSSCLRRRGFDRWPDRASNRPDAPRGA